MKPGLLLCLVIAFTGDVFAHRLDEYLQATRISVATNRIDLSIDLTPGVAVADQLLAIIDQNGDGQISDAESAAYVQRVLKDLRIVLDEKTLALRVSETSFPTPFEARNGVGVIRIKATATVDQLTAGAHALSLTNAHLPVISVYLVNALVPKDPALKVTRQTRDELQKDYRLEFEVNSTRR